MTPLPPALGGDGELLGWRLDKLEYVKTWDSGEGAYRAGGRWNSQGVRAVYCSVDPATAILEVAVHTGLKALDAAPHVLTAVTILDPSVVYVVEPEALTDAAWLCPGDPLPAQQAFGDALLARHAAIVIPSVVSTHSWNLVLRPEASELWSVKLQERFVLDPRLRQPPA